MPAHINHFISGHVLHISCTLIVRLIFLYALAQSSPKGGFAKVDYAEHVARVRRQGQRPNGFHHLNETQLWLVA